MKKLLSFMLAAVLAVGAASVAFASERDSAVVLTIENSDGIALEGALLHPEKEYRFPLMLTEKGETRPLIPDDLDRYSLSVTALSGKDAMAEAGILESGRQMVLSLTPAAVRSASAAAVSYRITLRDQQGAALSQSTLSWKVGWPAAADESIGTATVIDPSAPVLTEKQLSHIQQLTGSGKASFLGNGWQYDVRLLSQPAVNFAVSGKAIKDITDRWADADFLFYDFLGRPSFDFSGTLTLDASALGTDTPYLYRYLDGVLYSLRFTENGDGTVSLSTKEPGCYAISDAKIPNGTAVGGAPIENGTDSSVSADKDNPSTGGSGFGVPAVVGTAVLFGVALTLARKKAAK